MAESGNGNKGRGPRLVDSCPADLVTQADTGGRKLGGNQALIFTAVALCWSLFQIWVASPLPYIFTGLFSVLNADDTKIIHLSFAFILLFSTYPARANSPRDRIPFYDWAMMAAAVACVIYLMFFKNELALRPGAPVTADVVTAGIGIFLLLEGARRALGPPLAVVAILFLAYVFFGDSTYLPDAIRWKGASFTKTMSHMWLSTEGVFGIALGVSASFVFLFVLFGLLLDAAGAGNYIIRLSFSLLGHFRGGPAKAAVLSSAMTGMISGSSIANVVTTGTFTIPLMKRVGFTPVKSGAVEVASSVNGQIMPPVMGAAAFLMVEYVGISYFEVVKHAFLPALVSYIALLYIVHLEAVKAGMRGLPKPPGGGARNALLASLIKLTFLAALLGGSYQIVTLAKAVLPAGWAAGLGIGALLAVAYLLLLRLAAQAPDLALDSGDGPITMLPRFSEVWRTGSYYALPVVVLVWCLMIERLSPGLSAFYAATVMIVIALTQRPVKALMRGARGSLGAEFMRGASDLRNGLIGGARSMTAIAMATATAGIIVGTVSLTGVGLVMAEFVELVSGGNLVLMLVFVAFLSLVLGMGLPTTANYIVVSSLLAGVVVELGAQNGLVVPLIAVHLFVFYFGIMADVTPPVGLASFAASAISGGDPIRTGLQAFKYSLRTVLLPFLFIFNTDLLLINVSFAKGAAVLVIATLAMLAFGAATQGYFLVRSRLWETAALLLVVFTLLQPGYWLDMLAPPHLPRQPAMLFEAAAHTDDDALLRLTATGESLASGRTIRTTVQLPLGAAGASGAERLARSAGVTVREEHGKLFVDAVYPGSAAEKAGLGFDWEITSVEVPNEGRPPKELFYLPALALLALVAGLQRRRSRQA